MKYREVLIFFLVVGVAGAVSIVNSTNKVYQSSPKQNQSLKRYFSDSENESKAPSWSPEPENLLPKPTLKSEIVPADEWQPKVTMLSASGESWESRSFEFELAADYEWGIQKDSQKHGVIVNGNLELPISQIVALGKNRYSARVGELTESQLRAVNALDTVATVRLVVTVNDNPREVFRRGWSVLTLASPETDFSAL